MKFLSFLALSATGLTASLARDILDQVPLGFPVEQPLQDEQFLIELGPGNTQWVTEEEKWALKRVCIPSNYFVAAIYDRPH